MLIEFLGRTLDTHSVGLILTALGVVSVMSATVVILARRASGRTGGERTFWALSLAGVAGIGVWTTHFVAMLGFRPDLVLGYDLGVTLVSAILALTCVGGPLAATCYLRAPRARLLCGVVAGLGVGLMHFTGMRALQGCETTHDLTTSLVAFSLGAALIGAAMAIMGRRPALSAIAIVLGVCALHFTALHGLSLSAIDGTGQAGIDATVLSALVASGALGLCGAAFAAAYTETRVDSERRLADADRARQDAVFSLALRNMTNGLVMVDPDGRVTAYNQQALEMLGLAQDEVSAGMELSEMLGALGARGGWGPEELADFVADHMDWLRGGGTTRTERRFESGKTLAVTCRRMPEGGAILTYDDISQHRAAERKIEHLAYYDTLTGLRNRRGFRETARGVAVVDKMAAVLLIELDRFKLVNDTLGQVVGDAILVQVAERLRRSIRKEEQVFRLGVDEFAIVSGETDAEGGRAIAERVRACFEQGFEAEGHTVALSCSIGIAASDAGDKPKLVEMAGLALHQAKSLGAGRIATYENGMMERAVARVRTEIDLGRALAEGQLELFYQPQCALPSGRLIGFEALIRWRHPTRSLISPAEFIPISEANGMILEIGAWILDEACRQLARWPSEIEVAVNASAVQLRAPDFFAQVKEALDRHGVEPRRLEIELTETAMVEDGRQISETLRALRRLGVRIAMDDFGTGYSSLAHLRNFELDRIKIDRSFVDTRMDDIGARAVIRAVTSLARDLSITTVGEGVETREQLDRLIQLGCDIGQGYYLGKPMSAEDASRRIVARMFDDDLEADRATPPPGSIKAAS